MFIAKPFTEFSEADFTNVTAINVAGFFHLTQRVVSRMLQAGSGHIVNITSSLVAEQPDASLPAALTALTEGGLIAATRALAIEYASRGIRVNAVSPAATKTPMHSPEMYEFLAGLQPWAGWASRTKSSTPSSTLRRRDLSREKSFMSMVAHTRDVGKEANFFCHVPAEVTTAHERVWCDRLSHYRRELGSNPPHQGVQPVCSPEYEYVRLAGDACLHGLTSTHNRSNRDTMLAGSAVTLSHVV